MPVEQPRNAPAVVLLNFGGPRSLAEVEGFLFEILRDPNTIQLPVPGVLQNLLARRIARRRAPETARQYGEIGGKSPIVAATDALLEALRTRLAEAGRAVPVLAAHRYLPGSARHTAEQLVASGAGAVLALPLYPHFSFATTGSALAQLLAELSRAGFCGEVAAHRSYPQAPGYVEALCSRLGPCLATLAGPPEKSVVLCSAHGLPASYVARGDPYQGEIEATVAALRARFPEWRFEISFQSRVGPAEWLRPYTDEILPRLAAQGVADVVFLPLSFVNDHIETLYEIGHTYFGQARALGMTPHLVPAVEHHPAFVAYLESVVAGWLAGGPPPPVGRGVLPPDQSWRRIGVWAWGLWALALIGVVLFALL